MEVGGVELLSYDMNPNGVVTTKQPRVTAKQKTWSEGLGMKGGAGKGREN
jgi:hypothetical protein